MCRYLLVFSAFFCLAFLDAGFAEELGERDPACLVPSERIQRHMNRFALQSKNWDNDRARAAVRGAEAVVLTDDSDYRICEALWHGAGHLLAKRKQTEDGEFFLFDAGFFRFGPYYVVAILENSVDPAKDGVHPLERIHTGAHTGIVLFNSDLVLLGNYDYRGHSLDRNPDLILKE